MISPSRKIRITASNAEFYREAAGEFVHLSREAVDRKGLFTVALSGGTTPRGLYDLLADETESFRAKVPWSDMHVFFGDERTVGPNHPESNYRLAHVSLLSKVPVPEKHVHRIEGENPDPKRAAAQYEGVLLKVFRLRAGEVPRFDLVLLGMGADGHTASLFPGAEVIHENERLVAASWVEKLKTYRITLTPPVLTSAACAIFLVLGDEKAETLRSVLQGGYRPERFPAQIIWNGPGRTLIIADDGAARLLDTRGEEKRNKGGSSHGVPAD